MVTETNRQWPAWTSYPQCQCRYNCVKCLLQSFQAKIQQASPLSCFFLDFMLCTGVASCQPHTAGWGLLQGGVSCLGIIPAPIRERTHCTILWATAVSPYPCFHLSISVFLQCSKEPLGPEDTFTFHHFQNLALSPLPPLLRLWFHNCFNLTKV